MQRKDPFVVLGLVGLIYWAAFYAFSVFSDLYLSAPGPGLVLKFVFPAVVAVNLVGAVVAVRRLLTKGGPGGVVLALHGLPLLAALGFGWWLMFGVAI